MKHAELTDKIIACFYVVYNTLGYGFLESVYRKAMVIELEKIGRVSNPSTPSAFSTMARWWVNTWLTCWSRAWSSSS